MFLLIIIIITCSIRCLSCLPVSLAHDMFHSFHKILDPSGILTLSWQDLCVIYVYTWAIIYHTLYTHEVHEWWRTSSVIFPQKTWSQSRKCGGRRRRRLENISLSLYNCVYDDDDDDDGLLLPPLSSVRTDFHTKNWVFLLHPSRSVKCWNAEIFFPNYLYNISVCVCVCE